MFDEGGDTCTEFDWDYVLWTFPFRRHKKLARFPVGVLASEMKLGVNIISKLLSCFLESSSVGRSSGLGTKF